MADERFVTVGEEELSASVASEKENRCQNQFNQMNNVQNINSNSVPFMVLPSITNYGNITIKYNIRKPPPLNKGLQKEEKKYCRFKKKFCDICFIFIIFVIIVIIIFTILLKSLKKFLII